jgi:hypothetical protein
MYCMNGKCSAVQCKQWRKCVLDAALRLRFGSSPFVPTAKLYCCLSTGCRVKTVMTVVSSDTPNPDFDPFEIVIGNTVVI